VKHPSEDEIAGFIHGRLGTEEQRRVVRHLLVGCRRCSRRLSPFAGLLHQDEDLMGGAGVAVIDFYDQALDRAAEKARRYHSYRRRESDRLERALTAARTHPSEDPPIYKEVLALDAPTQVEALLRLSFEERYRSPERMLLLALSAKIAAEGLDPDEHGTALTADLRARTWAELGNALRVKEEWSLAEEALAQANKLLDEGTGDVLLSARIADILASLYTDRRRLGEALDLLEMVYELYQQAGNPHLVGRTLIKWGITSHYDSRPRDAMSLLRDGLKRIDSAKDPLLSATAQQALIHAMADCGEFQEAGRLLLGSGLRQAFAADPLNLLKLRAVEGKVLAGLGKLRRAERALEEALDGFLAREREYDAALVGLELAAVWLQQGKTAEVAEMVEETVDLLHGLGLYGEGLKATLYLRDACHRRRATVGLVRQVHDFLARLHWQPHLRFAV
jgi:tetratricopeptide (TPR) repeat protein